MTMNYTVTEVNLNHTEWWTDRIKAVPYDSLMTYFLIIDYIIIVPIIVGNLLILISICRYQRLRTRMHILIGNLAVSDLLLGAIFIPYDILFMTNLEFTSNMYICLTRTALLYTFLGASVLNLLAISFERYISIIHPLYPWEHSKFILVGIISASWIFSATLGLLPLLGWNNWETGMPCDMALVLTKPYRNLIFLFYLLSLIANFVMYVKVVRSALRHIRAIEAHPSLKSNSVPVNIVSLSRPTKKNYKKTKLMMLLLGVFALCWGPYMILVFIDNFFLEESSDLMTARKFVSALGMLNSGLNWIIFGLKNSTFRSAFKDILTCGHASSEGSLWTSTTC
ncbi:hypothetical protein FSP39_004083 [Pinctada imbricata]|uniref:G-protein coupled receptors family 1 profile domain-containing protein n=1 Tax=Pinctada imbricata TaxID=66713 RepID=A0AA88XS69_PINIB|nr:hypothetical protein FSP39_004083 [Pinctada imbricata]